MRRSSIYAQYVAPQRLVPDTPLFPDPFSCTMTSLSARGDVSQAVGPGVTFSFNIEVQCQDHSADDTGPLPLTLLEVDIYRLKSMVQPAAKSLWSQRCCQRELYWLRKDADCDAVDESDSSVDEGSVGPHSSTESTSRPLTGQLSGSTASKTQPVQTVGSYSDNSSTNGDDIPSTPWWGKLVPADVEAILRVAAIEASAPWMEEYIALPMLHTMLLCTNIVQERLSHAPKFDVAWDALLRPLLQLALRAVKPPDGDYKERPYLEGIAPLSARQRFLGLDIVAIQCVATLIETVRSPSSASLFVAFIGDLLVSLEEQWPEHLSHSNVNGCRALCTLLFYGFTTLMGSPTMVIRLLKVIFDHIADVHDVHVGISSRNGGFGISDTALSHSGIFGPTTRCDDGATGDTLNTLLVTFVYLTAFVEHTIPPQNVFYIRQADSQIQDQFDSAIIDDPTQSLRSLPPTARVVPTATYYDPLGNAVDRIRNIIMEDRDKAVGFKVAAKLWRHRRLSQWLAVVEYPDGGFHQLLASKGAVLATMSLHAMDGGTLLHHVASIGVGPTSLVDQTRVRSRWRHAIITSLGGKQQVAKILQSWSSIDLSFATI